MNPDRSWCVVAERGALMNATLRDCNASWMSHSCQEPKMSVRCARTHSVSSLLRENTSNESRVTEKECFFGFFNHKFSLNAEFVNECVSVRVVSRYFNLTPLALSKEQLILYAVNTKSHFFCRKKVINKTVWEVY